MFASIAKALFGTKNDREIKRMSKLVNTINQMADEIAGLDDESLKAKTPEFKQRYEQGESLDQLLPEAFAVVREASTRVMDMRHFDVQMIGGISLHEGRIAEMRTGEGKTLTATLPAYLNALSGGAVHVVTVNDYLAERDANWMRPLYEFLGLSVGIILSQQPPEEKKAAYQADITYGTNNEFGFDFLRDNMVFTLESKTQRDLSFALVDEVDSILIDEARTPLIISGPASDSSELYRKINVLIPTLKRQMEEGDEPGDFIVDEKQRQVELTEDGHQKIEQELSGAGLLKEGESLYAPHNLSLLHHVNAGLRAHALFERDKDYIVQNGQVVIVDEHTGRTMPGRRWAEGIHQAVEAKENLEIQQENQTLASTTFQNYFRLYKKLSGMTGTADTEAPEFRQIYGMDVVVIPTNRDMVRQDMNDLIYLSMEEKFDAIVDEIRAIIEKGAPVLVGTANIASSEYLAKRLQKEKIKHQVLNAKFHRKEAEIIAQAGQPGAVTIATNMAGRGTDIVLGGNPEVLINNLENPSEDKIAEVRSQWQKTHDQVLEAGGLHIIATERHESRRIDNQLRGRAGRQGDPGYSRFYLSMDDDLMRIFASDRVRNMMRSLGMEKGEPIEHRWVTRAIENAQRKVEGRNFDIRKNLLEYDDVANDQRRVIYHQRDEILAAEDLSNSIVGIRQDVIRELVHNHMPPGSVEAQWDIEGMEALFAAEFNQQLPVSQWLKDDNELHIDGVIEKVTEQLEAAYQAKEAALNERGFDSAEMRRLERHVMLSELDRLWKDHLANMDHLRQGIGLRGYAQRNPKQEYKRESYEMFQELMNQVQHQVIRILHKFEIRQENELEQMEQARAEAARKQAEAMKAMHPDAQASAPENAPEQAAPEAAAPASKPVVRQAPKIGRNDPCHCGSGKKYKHCHGRLEG